MIYYSPSTNAFYDDAIHGPRKVDAPLSEAARKAGRKPKQVDNPDCRIPADANPVSEDDWKALMSAQAEGQIISAKAGRPVAATAERTAEEQEAANRMKRDRLLAGSDWTQLPDALLDEPEYKAAMAIWRLALRDMDLVAGAFPEEPVR